ncbi:MAG: DUF2959 domain-containing protein [Desulfuromonas sp.]|uniref:DUF2959 domain-containing protein n=1 Tax=Desulfuromonas sp. TaxID=892 RepID=UPI000CBB33E2|nr:DUF2959 domain-containing protein [Desulfuromonas sp.]PLX86664.1 MAG: DUF2959 domain-containing protein [Desulfuromonas sp.]
MTGAVVRFVRIVGVLLFASLFLAGCQSAYYSTMEKFGVHKRDILVDRVEEARDSQREAKEQFSSALEQFSAVLGFQGGELEEKYDKLKAELDRSEERAAEVRDRVDRVEHVAEALFDEWKDELDQYSSASLRRSSQQKLDQTRRHYAKLKKAMRRAEAKIDPVLTPLRDQVLYLKHNLNARAIASLQAELGTIETDVAALIREMEASIREADAFISAMEAQ